MVGSFFSVLAFREKTSAPRRTPSLIMLSLRKEISSGAENSWAVAREGNVKSSSRATRFIMVKFLFREIDPISMAKVTAKYNLRIWSFVSEIELKENE